ncbi:MAG: MFS transporter [Planctomycetaceae bacterium]
MLLAAVPAALVLVLLAVGVRARPRVPAAARPPPPSPSSFDGLGAPFRRLLLALFLFTLARSTDALLILRLHGAGVGTRDIALLWALPSLVRAAATAWSGGRTDRFGARTMLSCGWVWFAAVYTGLALVSGSAGVIALFLAFGLYSGFVEPAERAWVASLAPEGRRGLGYGLFHAAVGLGALPGGLILGAIWARAGAPAAFLAAAAIACGALLLLRRVPQL